MSGVPAPQVLRAAEVAALVGGVLHGADTPLTGVASLDSVEAGELAFHDRKALIPGPGVVLTRTPVEGRACIVVADPLAAFDQVLCAWFPEPSFEGAVHPTARLGWNVVVPEADAKISVFDRAFLFSEGVYEVTVKSSTSRFR